MIHFRCPSCEASYSVPDDKGGKRTNCPKCGQQLLVPAARHGPTVQGQVIYPVVPVLANEEIADVLPAAGEEPILEVLPVAGKAPAKPGPILDPSGRYYVDCCLACGRRLRVPRRDAGRVIQCPSCRFFHKAPGKRRGEDDGLPVVIRVSAYVLVWPTACACCLRDHDTFLKVSFYRYTTRGYSGTEGLINLACPDEHFWKVPYCWDCLEHVQSGDEYDVAPACAEVGPAVEYKGLFGTVHDLRFYNWQYANRFLAHNLEKCLW